MGLPIEMVPEHLAGVQRIEVKWHIVIEDERPKSQWWGAAVHDLQRNANGQWKARLRYEAKEELGFNEEEDAEIVFLTTDSVQGAADSLVNVDTMEELQWRREGATHDTSSDEGSKEDATDVVELQQLCEEQAEFEREMNASVDDLVMQHMREHMPMDQQLRVASGYRAFADHLLAQLRTRVQESGSSSYTVTAQDIEDITARFKHDRA